MDPAEARVIPVMYLHLEEARRFSPSLTVDDLEHLVGPISDKLQHDIPWSKAIEQSVQDYVVDSAAPAHSQD